MSRFLGRKGARKAWDETMKQEVGVLRAPGEAVQKKHTTRRIIKETQQRTRHVAGIDELDLKKQARLERLELTNAWDPVDSGDVVLAEEEDDDDVELKRRKRVKEAGGGRRPPPRSLSKTLLTDQAGQNRIDSWIHTTVGPSLYPMPQVCVVTGKVGKYTDPSSQLRFFDRRALAVLREAAPPWVKTTPVAPYWEAVNSLLEPM